MQSVVDCIRADYGRSLSVKRFLGGASNGAWLVGGVDGPMVLKYGTHPVWVARASRLSATVSVLHAARYPAAAVYSHGELSIGGYFLLEEVLPGAAMARHDHELRPADVRLLLDLVERHRQITPPGGAWWNDYLHEAVFGRQHEVGVLAAAGVEPVEALLDRALTRLTPLCSTRLADDQFVMGDFGAHNVLIERGAVSGVVDLEEASGRGDSVIDLARTFVRLDKTDLVETAMPAVERAGDGLAIAGVYWILAGLHAAVVGHPPAVWPSAIAKAERRLETLFAACKV